MTKTIIVQFNKKLHLPLGSKVKKFKTEFCKAVGSDLTVLMSVEIEEPIPNSPLAPNGERVA